MYVLKTLYGGLNLSLPYTPYIYLCTLINTFYLNILFVFDDSETSISRASASKISTLKMKENLEFRTLQNQIKRFIYGFYDSEKKYTKSKI